MDNGHHVDFGGVAAAIRSTQMEHLYVYGVNTSSSQDGIVREIISKYLLDSSAVVNPQS
jgi:hypothetical protein